MNSFGALYKELRKKHGRPADQWALWCKRPKTEKEREKVIIEAILTQRANWKNVQLAWEKLKRAKIISLKKISKTNLKKLASLIKPSGFYLSKAKYLLNLARFIIENYQGLKEFKKQKAPILRKGLLKLKGIGPETADSILLYALDKPVFVIDEYTRRLIKEKGLAKNFSYDFLQNLFEKNLRKDFRLYQDFHALIVIEGKEKNKQKRVIVGGTFEVLHPGHKALLKRAFSLANKGELVIGLTSDSFAKNLKKREIKPYKKRRRVLESFLKENFQGKIKIVKIEDIFGPALKEDFDFIVVSPETYKNALLINQKRRKIKKRPIKIEEIEFVLDAKGEPYSSTKILAGQQKIS